jgi:hypothetical protein
MSAQKRQKARNYIGLLSDAIEERRAAEARAGADHRVGHYVLGLMAAVFRRRSEARYSPSPRRDVER